MNTNQPQHQRTTRSERDKQRKLRMQRRKRRIAMMRAIVVLCAVMIIGLAAFLVHVTIHQNQSGTITVSSGQSSDTRQGNETSASSASDGQTTASTTGETSAAALETAAAALSSQNIAVETDSSSSVSSSSSDDEILSQAQLLAAGYDYDGAIDLLKSSDSYDSDSRFSEAVSQYEATKATCVAVDVTTVPHIFYHSLINDTDRAFNVSVLGQSSVDGMNAWMTTVEEFNKITQMLYDNGYVYVRLRDLVVETVDSNGNKTFTANTNLMLPPGKKAIVLSEDDLAYYHSYEAAGFPEKMVLDENGDVKCQYTDANGNTTIGNYDVVPLLNAFLEEHPDGSYHGARGMIAMTGYNGCFGYRTDIDYEVKANLMSDQAAWLEKHPDFDRQEEIEQATTIANALKEEGWEFASHTWGHLSVTQASAEKLAEDNQKWVENVANIVGETDTIIFAHGNDIGDWQDYASDNDKFNTLKSLGYDFYCNVDGSVPYWVQIRSNYVRQGRINLDGYMLYQASTGQTDVLDNLFDASQVFDSRRPTPVVANGQG